MAFMNTQWMWVQTSPTTVEIQPRHDVIEHRRGLACICNPFTTTEVQGYEVTWQIVHNSFADSLDEDEIEPYKGL